MTQTSPPSHDGSAAIKNVCQDDQKHLIKVATQDRFTLFWQQLHFVLTNFYAKLQRFDSGFDHYQIGSMQADAPRSNQLHDPYEVCKAGRSLGFMPFAGDIP